MTTSISRRTLLALLPAALSAQTKKRAQPLVAVGEFVPFLDPVTEARVVRLTNPSSSSWLPASANRFLSLKPRFLVFSSDRDGRPAPYQMDLHSGIVHALGETPALVPHSLYLNETNRILYLIDGGALKEINLANRRMQTLAQDVDAFAPVRAGEFVLVRRGRLELLSSQRTLAENVGSFCLIRPPGDGCLFTREESSENREYWFVSFSAQSPALLAKGLISDPFWSPGGKSLLFLRDVEGPNGVFAEIHEVPVETGREQCVAPTSQFASFAPNSDASVFVGASRSKAQPTVILLLRSTRRELTLCEHRASHPASVAPAFSPDSRRVYFASDREGKPALYSVNVELLVEPTVTG